MRSRVVLWGAGAVACVAIGAVVLARHRPVDRPTVKEKAPSPLAKTDAVYALAPERARSEYQAYVERNAASRVPEVQDHVGAARMRLGYLAARRNDLPSARQAFLAAAKTKGTGAAGAFGSLSDQAAYQAAVCLVAEGKKDAAIASFEDLLKTRPLSPLSRAAYGRLKRLNGGEPRPDWDALMQAAVAKQEARIRFETSVCGPKCLEHLLATSSGDRSQSSAIVGDSKPLNYKALAKLCGTTDDGTTIEGMRKGLKALGRESWAAKLNRADLAKAKLPLILLQGDHYVVLERLDGDTATLWDPRFASTTPWKLPPADDPDFAATAILLSKPEGL